MIHPYARLRSGLMLAIALVICAQAGSVHAQPEDDCITLTGRIYRIVKDAENGSETFTYLHDSGSGRTWELGAPTAADGALVQVEVRIAGDQATLCGDAMRVVEPRRMDADAENPRRVVVLLVSFADAPLSTRCTPSALQQTLFTSSTSMAAYYAEATFGAISFDPDADGNGAPDVFGPFTIDSTTGNPCSISETARQADEAATAAGVDLGRYRYRVYVTPDEANCGNWGTVGCHEGESAGTFCRSWVEALPAAWPDRICTSTAFVFAHEIGHNLGLHHASTDFDLDRTVDAGGEYGDWSDVMGSCCITFPHFNAPHKEQLGVFAAPGSIVHVPSSGGPYDYTIVAIENEWTHGDAPRILRLGDWSASTRAAVGFDRNLDSWYELGIHDKRLVGTTSIHRFEAGPAGRTLLGAILRDGEKFTAGSSGYLIEQLSHTAKSVRVRVWPPGTVRRRSIRH